MLSMFYDAIIYCVVKKYIPNLIYLILIVALNFKFVVISGSNITNTQFNTSPPSTSESMGKYFNIKKIHYSIYHKFHSIKLLLFVINM